jgi:SAM-dependent methyltransferase
VADTTRFYDDLAPHFHLLFEDWDAAVRWQGGLLAKLISDRAGAGSKRVLDAACGIGTQAIGLALHGHRVTASDLSPAAVARARREALRFGVEISCGVADLRRLSAAHAGPFDLVCALDNAVAHMGSDGELSAALAEMTALLAPGGLILLSTRDYDAILAERPSALAERVIAENGGRRRVSQLWHWLDETRYGIRIVIVRETEGGSETMVFSGHSRAVTRARLNAALTAAGLEQITWRMPGESGYYQPIVTARRPG